MDNLETVPMRYAVALAAMALALSAGAAAAADQCFRTQDMRNHKIVDDHTLYVGVGVKDVYRMEMKGACLAAATNSDPLVIEPVAGNTLVCKALDLDVAVSRGGFKSPCIVERIVKLTPEEVAAIPKNLRP